ncbi:MAG: 3'-5' exonuclease [Pseudomonadota bacterium]|nr:3'-5' exonuclease [Pseudomonadota bacterium]
MRFMVFDIETVPDTDLGAKILGLSDISEEDIAKAMVFNQTQKTGSDFLPLFQHKIVAISVAWRSEEGFKVWSLGESDSPEKDLIQRFFDGIDRYTPGLVSWNGSGFDLPVLHYRSLVHHVQAPRYWENGDNDRDFRYNNYQNRFHWRHIDLMDVLSGFQSRARASLDDIATMLGFPGKMGMGGDKVWDCFRQGQIKQIRDYCETDVLNTYLVYLQFQFIRGEIDATQLEDEFKLVRDVLSQANKDQNHLVEFSKAWLD